MGSQPTLAGFHVLTIACGQCNAELTYKIGAHHGHFKQMGGQAIVCPNCAREIYPHFPGTLMAGPFVAARYGKQTHVACKKCGRNIFVTSATAFLRNGERHLELTCDSPACGHVNIYNEVELEIHGD